MTAKPKSEKSQPQKFRDLAREAGCDEDEEHFDAALKRVAKAPAPKETDQKKTEKRK
jgi:hypothetical protein